MGVYPDMTEHGWPSDEWPQIHEQVMAADILVLCTPISSVRSRRSTKAIERLYGNSSVLNDAGQYAHLLAGSAGASSPATKTG
jgi:multimeric flavodoxin WrbA